LKQGHIWEIIQSSTALITNWLHIRQERR